MSSRTQAAQTTNQPRRLTLSDLRRWTDNGATWRLAQAEGDRPLIELCTCHGEAVDLVEPAPDLLEALQRGEITAG